MEDVLSFGSAISACAHGHHWRFSLMLLDTKDADAVACNGAVDACAKVHVGTRFAIWPFRYSEIIDSYREARQWRWAMTLCQNCDALGRSFALEA